MLGGSATIIRKAVAVLLGTLSISSLACAWCCGWGNFPLYDSSLASGYSAFAPDEWDQLAIHDEAGSAIIWPMVFAYGWNDDFIIAQQHPKVYGLAVDVETTNWFIIDVASGDVHGSLSQEEYNELRQRLGVPDSLVFTFVLDAEDWQ